MKVTVIGAGHVGLVTAACLASKGHQVECVEISRETVEMLQRGEIPFFEAGLEDLVEAGLKNGRLRITNDLSEGMSGSRVSLIVVNTPTVDEDIDLTCLLTAARQIGKILQKIEGYHVVVVKSTVVPGTTENFVRQELENASGLKIGNFGLCMNPEFLREGTAVSDCMDPDRIVIGQWDERSGKVLTELYANFKCPILCTTLQNAELIKYSSNSLLATLISFSNEIASLCESIPGADVETIMKGLHLDRRISPIVNGVRVSPEISTYLRAGSGFGGSCLPKDVNALRTFAKKRKIKTPVLDSVMEVNHRRPTQVIRLLEKTIGKIRGRIIAVLGLAFKPGTDDLRESPAIRIISQLIRKGAKVRAYDPIARPAAKSLLGLDEVTFYDNPESALSGADAALIATAWPEFTQWDWVFLGNKMRQPVIVDGRNALGQVQLPSPIVYQPIGCILADEKEDRAG